MIRRELPVPPEVLRGLATQCPQRYPVLFDSAVPGHLGRTSVLVSRPTAALWLDAAGCLRTEGAVPAGVVGPGGGFLDALDRWLCCESQTRDGTLGVLPDAPVAGGADVGIAAEAACPAFPGGWAVYLGYEIAAECEPRLVLPAAAAHPWQAFALRVACALVHDERAQKVFAVAEEAAATGLAELEADALALAGAGILRERPAPPAPAEVWEEAPGLYLERVRRAQEYIGAGEIYQANLSRPWRVTLSRASEIGTLYERLRTVNPAPFAALVQWRGAAVLSSSPERLLRVAAGRIETRPIAGTRARSREAAEDAREAVALAAHPKERAEHVMLIDLERNDLGRVCAPGTVRVQELMAIESWAHVHHIVSTVSGRLRPEVTAVDVLRALFPGGTITGCPKYRCMQIIAELEDEGRGAYTGSLGLIGRDGSMDFNILIRTLRTTGPRTLELRTGAGIVADSDPERELQECRAKARGLLAVFEQAPGAGVAA